jgi:hypothetical protein
MGKVLQVWREGHPALGAPGRWEDLKRPPTAEELDVSARMPFGEFFRVNGEISTTPFGTQSATMYRIVEVHE